MTTTNEALLPYFQSTNEGLTTMEEEDELLHPKQNALVKDQSVTETQYFGFSVPEEKIHALAMISHRPHVGIVTGGVFCWRGVKRTMVAAELCDFIGFQDDKSFVKSNKNNFRLDNGYGIQVVEPLKKIRMTYSDSKRKNTVDLEYTAMAPPVMFKDRKHFEQPMRVRGELVLRGERYDVNCTNVRDGSWARARPETNFSDPPISWMIPSFNEKLSFNVCMFDNPVGNPELKGRFEVPPDKVLTGGWVCDHGEYSRIVKAYKRVERDASLLPKRVELKVTDDRNRSYEILGTHMASCPWQVWPNFYACFSLMRWECNGLVTYNDCQDGLWNDYLTEHMKF